MPAIHKRVWAQSFTYFIEYRIKEENDWTQSTQISISSNINLKVRTAAPSAQLVNYGVCHLSVVV